MKRAVAEVIALALVLAFGWWTLKIERENAGIEGFQAGMKYAEESCERDAKGATP
jgi:hypothetical protein